MSPTSVTSRTCLTGCPPATRTTASSRRPFRRARRGARRSCWSRTTSTCSSGAVPRRRHRARRRQRRELRAPVDRAAVPALQGAALHPRRVPRGVRGHRVPGRVQPAGIGPAGRRARGAAQRVRRPDDPGPAADPHLPVPSQADPNDVENAARPRDPLRTSVRAEPQYLPYAIKQFEALLELGPERHERAHRPRLGLLPGRDGSTKRSRRSAGSCSRTRSTSTPTSTSASSNWKCSRRSTRRPRPVRPGRSSWRRMPTAPMRCARTELLDQVKKEAAAAGQPITVEGGTL